MIKKKYGSPDEEELEFKKINKSYKTIMAKLDELNEEDFVPLAWYQEMKYITGMLEYHPSRMSDLEMQVLQEDLRNLREFSMPQYLNDERVPWFIGQDLTEGI